MSTRQKKYYIYNGTGNVIKFTASNGLMFLRYTCDPFGNVESIKAPMVVDIDDLNRYTYNGEDRLQPHRARYYNTSLCGLRCIDTRVQSEVFALPEHTTF